MASKMAVKDLHASAPAQEEGLEELTESIKKHGIKMPLVVNSIGLVFDGVRRLQAARNLGLTQVPVVVTQDFDATMDQMYENRKQGDCYLKKDHRRVFQAYVDVYGQMAARVALFKSLPYTERTKQPILRKARDLLKLALNVSDSSIQAAVQFGTYAADPAHPLHEVGLDLTSRMDAGMSGSMALNTFTAMRRRGDPGKIMEADEQREIMNNALVTMSTLIETFARLEFLSPKLKRSELEAWRAAFKPFRGQIQKTTNSIRNLIEEKNSDR